MKLRHLATATALLVIGAQTSRAQVLSSATQSVSITVTAVDQITVSSPTVAISVGVGTVHNTATTYSITTNSSTARVIKGQITTGADFPTGVSLTVELTPPSTGTPGGAQTLIVATAATLVTGITNVAETGLQIDYAATATVSATPAALSARTITFTVQ